MSNNGSEVHGEVLRYDSQGEFRTASSWAAYDAGANGVGTDPDGYHGCIVAGQYVYFVPWHNGSDWHGEVLRFDATGSFTDASSWETYDAGANGVGTDPDGYVGGVFDGQYVYFTPNTNGTGPHGEVLRYDTSGTFSLASSWATYDPSANGVGVDPEGYEGNPAFDGRYIYFAPLNNGTSYHGEVLRYDATGSFTDASSWETYDAGANGVGTDPDGYIGAVFDGQYVYFVPNHNGTESHGEVLRYDTQAEFLTASSWATYDPGANGIGADPDGYSGGSFDGRHVYLAPKDNGSERHGEVLRYDTTNPFGEPSSWSTYDYGADPLGCAQDAHCTDPDGYYGATFQGHYVFFWFIREFRERRRES